MRWLKRKLAKWVNEYNNEPKPSREIVLSADSESVCSEPILNFKVFPAVGGRVVEFRYYDRKMDRNHNTTYIITNEQDFGERISKIATLEVMKT
jgi:hypothetical protein